MAVLAPHCKELLHPRPQRNLPLANHRQGPGF